MSDLPGDVRRALVDALGRWLRAQEPSGLPGRLRPLRNFRPRTLQAHAGELLGALDDDVLRARVGLWLKEQGDALGRRQRELLELAVERPEGWEERLAGASEAPDLPQPSPTPDPERELERERRRLREARAEARRERDRARAEIASAQARVEEAERRAAEALSERERALAGARAEIDRLRGELDSLQRELRRLERAAQRAAVDLEAERERTRQERRRAARAEREAADLRARLEQLERVARREPPRPAPRRARRRLPVPPGRFEDDPETLGEWLSAPGVHVLVDGYNVSKSEAGFAGLDLETQRERLVDALERLALRRGVPVTVVFDGADVPPGTARLSRRHVRIEYSRPGESADDHLVALLEGMEGDPVVVVTDDRELRERVARREATPAGAAQLLALIR